MFAVQTKAMKFLSFTHATNYTNRAFETTGTSLTIIQYDYPYYYVCSRREASQLMKQGYELAIA